MLTDEVKQCLQLRKGLNIVMTVGNRLRRDDGVGSYIASRLCVNEHLVIFDAETTPESFVDRIIELNPSYLLFIDAANFGGFPGQIRIIHKNQMSDFTLSTHMFPLRAIWEIIEHSISAEIRFIGIQPVDCGFGEELSDDVKHTADDIISLLNSAYKP